MNASTKKLNAVSRQWAVPSTILGIAHNRRGDGVAAALGDGSIALMAADDRGEDPQILVVHDGVSLSLAPDADDHAFLSGGDDGRVYLVEPNVGAATLLAEHPGQWIDHVAAGPSGLRAYASGKKLYRLSPDGEPVGEVISLPSSIGALAFSPNGKRLAAAHHGGVSLFWTEAETWTPDLLPWPGSHIGLMWSPDGTFLMSAQQDQALHGWKMGQGLSLPEPDDEMQMQGYEAKVDSMAFTAKGRFLATSGAGQVICWPFFDGGPWGQPPMTLGGADGRIVTRVAPHPRDEMLAAGYEDGMIILAPFDGRMEIMIFSPPGGADCGVTGLGWNAEGDSLIATLARGDVLLFTLASISRFVRGQYA